MRRKYFSIYFIILSFSVLLLSCGIQENVSQISNIEIIEEENELYTDLPERMSDSRHYDVRYLKYKPSNTDRKKADKKSDYSDLLRFAFYQYEYPGLIEYHNQCEKERSFVFDLKSQRMYTNLENKCDITENLVNSDFGIDINEEDTTKLIALLEEISFHELSKIDSYDLFSDYEWVVSAEYEDGSLEYYGGKSRTHSFPKEIIKVKSFIEEISSDFEERQLFDRKNSVNIDRLLTVSDLSVRETVSYDNIARISFFRAETETWENENGNTIYMEDHSRQEQELLLIDVAQNQVYYNKGRPVYENIEKSESIQFLEEAYLLEILSFLEIASLESWEINEFYKIEDNNNYPSGKTDIPAWAISIVYEDGTIIHYYGEDVDSEENPEGFLILMEAVFSYARS